MKEPNENDELWSLLGESPRREASPYFARKVRRTVEEEASRPAFSLTRLLRWIVPVSACAAVALGWSVYSWRTEQEQELARFNEAFDAMADLQSLVVAQDVSSWIASGN